MEKLTFIDSNHEQREMNVKFIPEKGDWVEEGKFYPIIERFDIHKRYKCIDKQVIGNEIIVTIKEMGRKQQQRRVNKLAKKLVEKHHDILVFSLLKVLVRGVYQNQGSIEDYVKHAKDYNNLEEREKYQCKQGLIKRIEKREGRIKRSKKRLKSDKQLLKELEAEENGKQESSK